MKLTKPYTIHYLLIFFLLVVSAATSSIKLLSDSSKNKNSAQSILRFFEKLQKVQNVPTQSPTTFLKN